MAAVLVIDDDRIVRELVVRAVAPLHVETFHAGTAEEGYRILRERDFDVILLDVVLPDANGIDIFKIIKDSHPRVPVIFVTADTASDTAIEAMKLGAFNYIVKPLHLDIVRDYTSRAIELRHLMNTPVEIHLDDSQNSAAADRLIGRSPAMQEVYKGIGRVAAQDVTTLVLGESGTGKELVARAIYQHSRRANAPFLAINCAALPETLLESELFGHERGSFTGADRQRIGKFEQCNGGTILLDEVGDMSISVQAKVLRLLQEQRFERVGGSQTISTDVRIIAATNRDLEDMVAAGTFRGDLYYRLNQFTIEIPPLRERGDDQVLLAEYFLRRYSQQMNKHIDGFSADAIEVIKRRTWPGNIRELQSAIRQAVLMATAPVIVASFLPSSNDSADLPPAASQSNSPNSDLARFVADRLRSGTTSLHAEAVEWLERYLLSRVLELSSGNQSQAARILGISRSSLRFKLRTLNLSIGATVQEEYLGEEEAVSEAPVRKGEG